jgi:hypothetical protein
MYIDKDERIGLTVNAQGHAIYILTGVLITYHVYRLHITYIRYPTIHILTVYAIDVDNWVRFRVTKLYLFIFATRCQISFKIT